MIDPNQINIQHVMPPKSIIKKAQTFSHAINAYNISELDTSTLTSLTKVSNFVINIVEKKNISETEGVILAAIKYKLDADIEKYDTSGIYNFFKYLFQPSVKAEKQLQFDSMLALQKLIKNIKIANQKKKPAVKKTVQFIETPVKKKPIESKDEKTSPKSIPSKVIPKLIIPSSAALAKILQESLKKPIQQSSTLPDPISTKHSIKIEPVSTLPTVEKSPIEKPSSSISTEELSTTDSIIHNPSMSEVTLMDTLKDNSSSQEEPLIDDTSNSSVPPPPPSIGFFPAPPFFGVFSKKVTVFENEPKEPTIKLNVAASTVGVEKLKQEITEMQLFVTAMKKTLEPIQTAINREQELEKMLKEKKELLLPIQQETIKEEKKFEFINQDKPVIKLKLQVKKDELMEIPLFSDEKFKEINVLLNQKGAELLPSTFLKSEYQKILNNNMKKLHIEKQKLEDEILEIENELSILRKTQNNGIAFKDFAATLKKKNLILSKWTSGMNLRKKQLAKLLAPFKPKSQTTKKPKPDKVIVSENLTKQYPELANIVTLYQNPNASILITGSNYHANLVI